MLGAIATLAMAATYLVTTHTDRWPYEFKRGLDIQGGMHLVLQAAPTADVRAITPEVMGAAIAVVRSRVDGLGVAEPLIQPKGADQIIVDLPGIKDPDEALRVLGTTAVLTFRARAADYPEGRPAPAAPGASAPPGGAWVLTGLDGKHLKSVRVDPLEGGWAVTADFDAAGAAKLAEVSRALYGKPLGIFLDDRLVSDPVVRAHLETGNVQITGGFDAAEANELMVVLRAGSLPVPLTVVENRAVDASLGAEAVRASMLAGVVGLVAVVAFMIGWYGLPGVVATLALLIYGVLVLAVFKLVPVTLTVPGIAGFVLSLGMAVDANILIFERTREELQAGRTLFRAIEAGFERAFSAILDSNVTSLLACGVLFAFGTGPVKGFALTLAVGIVISMFTAITATRTLLHAVLEAAPRRGAAAFGVVPAPTRVR
jgi:preprotein translocase subunit SecD